MDDPQITKRYVVTTTLLVASIIQWGVVLFAVAFIAVKLWT